MKRAETPAVPDSRDPVVIVLNCMCTKTNRLAARVQHPPEQRALDREDVGHTNAATAILWTTPCDQFSVALVIWELRAG